MATFLLPYLVTSKKLDLISVLFELQVGSMLKTPSLPIWLIQVNGTYGLLFCTTRDLVTDWKTERYFCLHYFNGHFTQQNETLLTLGESHS